MSTNSKEDSDAEETPVNHKETPVNHKHIATFSNTSTGNRKTVEQFPALLTI